MRLKELHLLNYRNFETKHLKFKENITIIVGDNGIGKTNLLESMSLLSPGRGLRHCAPDEICKDNQTDWEISSILDTNLGLAEIEVSYSAKDSRKIVQFNDSKISNSELSNITNIIWLTPQMDGLFLGSPGDRRRFLDRMVFSVYRDHASKVLKYEKLQRERIKILETNENDDAWLTIIEKEMTELAINIIQNRLDVIHNINRNIENLDSAFPKAKIELEGRISDLMEQEEPHEQILAEFKSFRMKDKFSGRTNFGAGKCDMLVFYESKNMSAKSCSTGEQKALLISIITAQQISLDQKPILLLDEVFVHLDEKRRRFLADFLSKNGAQAIITTTEEDLSNLFENVEVITLEQILCDA